MNINISHVMVSSYGGNKVIRKNDSDCYGISKLDGWWYVVYQNPGAKDWDIVGTIDAIKELHDMMSFIQRDIFPENRSEK